MNNTKDNSITNVIKILTLLLLLVWCFSIIKPFVIIVVWAIVLAVAFFPLFNGLVKKMGDSKKKLVAIVFTVVVVSLLIVPTYFLTKSLGQTSIETIQGIRNHTLEIPVPDSSVKDWPLIGKKLYDNWVSASTNIEAYIMNHKEKILEYSSGLLSGVKGFIGAFLTIFASFLIAVVFMYNSNTAGNRAKRFIDKITGNEGEEIMTMSRDVIRSVVKGVLLVAIIQAGLAFIGFKAIGLPAAGVFTFLVLIAAIVQIPALIVMIPAIILVFSTSDSTPAIIFTIYSVIVALSDNVLKPMLLGKGLKTPMIVILLGAIGGMLLHGIIGLFIGPVVLAIMYRMYEFWLTPANNE
ncbi:AI-2E family transporter [uncultured Algibacter sp.]|uniref:AI-2E family transporter n=1 Tax=uncultured Algibacter sp. TaxID=298659 RepID=UPI002615EB11|nr:AI-2E family transporter [uncultured Algibacter sp.]